MAVVHIGKMNVAVSDGRMAMRMTVTSAGGHRDVMFVLMMVVMRMPVLMGEWLVRVHMGMLLGQMQPDAQGHEGTGHQQRLGDRFAQGHGQHRTNEGRHGKIRPRAPGTQVTQSDNKEGKTDAISRKTDQHGHRYVWQTRPMGNPQGKGRTQTDQPRHQALACRYPTGVRQ